MFLDLFFKSLRTHQKCHPFVWLWTCAHVSETHNYKRVNWIYDGVTIWKKSRITSVRYACKRRYICMKRRVSSASCVLCVESVRACFKCTHSRVCFVCYAILYNMLYATMRCVFVRKWYNVVWRWRPEVYFSVFCVCPEHQKVVSSCILLGCHLSSKMIWYQYQQKYSSSSFRRCANRARIVSKHRWLKSPQECWSDVIGMPC